MSKVIITGINGFVGEHLAREIKHRGYSVLGVGHDPQANEKVADVIDAYIGCDLLDASAVDAQISFDSEVDAVVHLAGLAAVGQSFEEPERFMIDNGRMTVHLLERALKQEFKRRIVIVSTGALYNPSQPLPLTEASSTTATSPYGVGKLFVEQITDYYRTRGLDVVSVRPFNHIGPGQGAGFILPDMYTQLQEAKADGRSVVSVGNIDTKRDYTDVRDIVRAYSELALARSLDHSLYNVCSGKSMSGRNILELLKQETNSNDLEAQVDESRIRPTDVAEIVGDFSRLQGELQWQPQIPIEQTIKDFVAFQGS